MDTAVSVELFVEILNRYLYYFDQQNETVSPPYSSTFATVAPRTDASLGDYQIHQWPHRAHTLKFANKPRKLELRGSKEAFSADAGLYLE